MSHISVEKNFDKCYIGNMSFLYCFVSSPIQKSFYHTYIKNFYILYHYLSGDNLKKKEIFFSNFIINEIKDNILLTKIPLYFNNLQSCYKAKSKEIKFDSFVKKRCMFSDFRTNIFPLFRSIEKNKILFTKIIDKEKVKYKENNHSFVYHFYPWSFPFYQKISFFVHLE